MIIISWTSLGLDFRVRNDRYILDLGVQGHDVLMLEQNAFVVQFDFCENKILKFLLTVMYFLNNF